MKTKGSPRAAWKLNNRTRIITAIITFSLLLLMLGVPAFMQSLQKGDAPDTAPAEKLNPKGLKPQSKSKADLEAAGQQVVEADAISPNQDLITTTTYAFTSATGVSLEDMSTGTSTLVGANLDDTASAVTNIGFEFWYDGVRFTQFSANANGLCRLGSTAVTTSFDNSTDFAATTNAPKIAPYFDDLWTGTNGKVHFKVIGAAPNRKLVVEWQNEQIPRVGSGSAGAGTFQMWLSETTGVIQFVYGSGVVLNSANGGYTIGLQSGGATNFASVTSSGVTVSYATANNTQTGAITSGTSYIFTPPTPTAPTNLTFTSVTPGSMTLNWTDNATNEVGYAVYQSTDNVSFTFLTQTAANATSQAVSGLSPSTTYFFRVFAVSSGALSSALTGSQATAAPGNITSTPVGGNWSATTTWVGGVVPTATDNVTIADGATVTIDSTATANAFSLSVGTGLVAPTTLIYNATTARTVTVATSVTIASNGIFQSAATGTITTHVLSVGTNLTNNGVLDFSTNTNTAGASITFTGAANNTFGGTGATTDIRAITINKGTSNANVLDVTTSSFTVRGAATDATNGYLTLTNGTFKISGTFTLSSRTFTANYTIAATAGIWLNNPNYTVSGINGSPTNAGLLRLTQGTYNIGTASGNSMDGSAGAVFIIEGGTMNATGRFSPQSAVSYTQSAGTVNVCTVGQSSSNFGSFELFSASSSFTMSGGTIVLHQASTATTPLDFDILGTVSYIGGTLQIGAGDTTTNFNFRINGNAPAITINNTTNNKTATVTAQTVVFGDTTVSPGTTLNLNGFLFAQIGNLVNNGTISGNTTSSRLYFAGNGAQTYSGSGVAGTNALPLQSVDFDSLGGVTFDPATTNNLITNRIIIFTGGVTNTNKLTLGIGGTSTGTVQIGNTTTATNAGSFDVAPTFNLGSGGQVISYLRTTNARTTGTEINPARTLTSMTYDDNDPTHALTLSGGDLTLSSAATALTLTNGRIITGSNTLALSSGTGAVTRTSGYVDGNLRKNITATGTKTFEVGTANGYSPLSANVTAGTGNMTVKATQGKAPYVSGTNALGRYWTLTGTGITANLTFTYLASDVTGTVANYQFIKNTGGALSILAPTGTPTSTSATINGVSSFSDWTLAEAGAVQPGTIEFSGVPASVNENAGSLSVSVFRTGGSDGAVSVQYTTTDGTATAGDDYTTQTGTLNWASGDAASKTINIPINDDSTYEDNETFTVNLSMPTGGATLGTAVKNVTINDNDSAPTFSINDVSLAEGDSGTTNFVFTVTKTGATASSSSVSFQTNDGTATLADNDYQSNTGSLTFLPAETTKQITVLVNGDTTSEPDETFDVQLSGAGGATISDDTGTGTIQNDDTANANPTISDIADQSVSQDNYVTASFTVNDAETPAANLTLTGTSGDQTLVPDANITFGGTGANRTVTVTPAAGQTGTATITVTVHDADSGTASDQFQLTVTPVTCYAPPSGMVSWYSAEGAANDIYGINNGTFEGTAAYSSGKVNQAFGFNGTDADVKIPASSSLNVGGGNGLTIDLWINPADLNERSLVEWNNNTGEPGIGAHFNISVVSQGATPGNLYANLRDTSGNNHRIQSNGGFISTNQWQHAALTYDKTTGMATIYLNGVAIAGPTNIGVFTPQTSHDLYLGYRPTDNTRYAGSMDEVEIFNRALTATEIAGIYNASSAGKCHTSTLQFSSATYNVNETDTQATITVTRTGAHDSSASVDYATADGTATGAATCAGVDYQTSTGTLNFAAGEVSKTFPVPVCDDLIFEGDETVNLSLSSATGTGVTLGTPDTAVLTINDDEGQPSLSVADFTFTGADSLVAGGFTVTLSHPSASTVTVHYQTSDDTATAGEDYTAASGTLTFDPGDTSKVIPITILADNVNEPTETFNIDLDNPANATISDGHAVGTIPNDDPEPTISIDDVTFNGTDSRGVFGFTVTLSNPSSQTITVHYTTSDDTAIAGEDYTAATGTLTFDPGDTTRTIPITILADNRNEPTETFNVDLDTPVNATISDGHGIGTIPNDDAEPTLSIDDMTHNEGDSGTTSYTFTVTKTGATSQTVTVDFTTADGTATLANNDYQSNTGSLTFLPGDATKTITVLVNGDTTYEADETFNVNLSNAMNATISDGQGRGTIQNDDAKPTLTITPTVTLTEGNSGTKNFNFTVTKSGATDLDATVSFATADGTATGGTCGTAGVDYASKSGTLTFHPADTTMTVTVSVCGDTTYEVNETFNVNLSSPTEATITNAQGTGTINNDDKPPATLIVNTTDDLNSGFCLAAHCSLREAIVAANSNSDLNTITFQLPAGDPGHFYYADDSTAGQLSRANVTATIASDDTTISGIDPDWPHSWWTISPQSALPSITATVTIDGYSQAGASPNTSAAGDNAVLRVEINGAGVGLNGLTVGGSGSTLKGLVVNRFGGSGVSLPGGLHSVSGNFSGTDTSGTISLANGAAGVTSNGFSNLIGGTTPAARNLLSGNTGDGISFTSGNSYLVQGNLVGTKADGTSALGNGASGVSFSGSALFNTVGGVDPGEANIIAFNGGDGIYVDATASVSNTVRGNSVYSNGTTSAHLGIDLGDDGVTPNDPQDADTGPNALQNFPVITSVTVTGSTKTITGTLNSKPNQEFTIDFYSNPSCDASGNGEGTTYLSTILTDTTDANGDVSFTFHPSTLTVGQVITATATDFGGSTSEFSQCVSVDNGTPGSIEFTAATYSVNENGGMAQITVKRVGGSQGSISATFNTSDGTATAGSDYTAVNNYIVTFADGDTANQTIDIPITDNMVYEGNETINLSLSSTTVNVIGGGANPLAAVLTILENDAQPTLSIDDVTFTGADSRVGQSFTVTLTGATDLPVTVHYATSDGTAIAGEDYTSATGTLTFNPGVTTQPIPIAIVADNRNEPTETFNVDLDTPVNATVSDGHGVGTIPNDDAEPTVSVDDFTFTGADSRTASGFTVSLSAPSSFTVTVHYATSDDTAHAGEDYTAATGTLTFDPGDTTKVIPITILGDSTNEPEETFFVDLDTPTHATIADGHGIGTIPNDDPVPSISIANATKVEGDSGSSNITFTVTLSNPSSQTISAQFTTMNGTASSGSDYTAMTGTVTFNPSQTTRMITVPVAGDIKDEANETFSVVLSNPLNASITTGTGVCTIVDDDLNTGDFDGDGKNDLAVFRPSADNTFNSKWYILNTTDGAVTETQFGTETDTPVAADYDGDGKKEIAVFRPSEGAWYISRGSAQNFVRVVWGLDGDKPVPGDYDGDGKVDIAVFRPSDGYWYIRRSSDDQLQAQPWGLSTDKPVPADYDGDGKTDLAVFRKDDPVAGSGTWYILKTSDGSFAVAQWGVSTDKLVPADYDLDGNADIAVWRPTDGTFYVRRSSDGGLSTAQWGLNGDVPIVGDYDGDGKADYAVFRPSSGHHFILKSSDGTYIGPIWGVSTDVPVAARYVPEQ